MIYQVVVLQRYIWWKQHMTTLQMVQFVGIMTHGFQFLFMEDNCRFPWQYGLYIGAHAVLFFILFSQFYIREYFGKKSKSKKIENQVSDRSSINHPIFGEKNTFFLRSPFDISKSPDTG